MTYKSLLESKITNSTKLNANFRLGIFTTIDEIDKRVERDSATLNNLKSSFVNYERTNNGHIKKMNESFIKFHDNIEELIEAIVDEKTGDIIQNEDSLKEEVKTILGTVAKETGANLASITTNNEKLAEVDQTLNNIQRHLNVQLQKINNLSKGTVKGKSTATVNDEAVS